jgi:hypothetical protein
MLVEQIREHALQLLLVEDRQQTPSFIANETLVGRATWDTTSGWRLRKRAIISLSLG